MSDRTVVWDLGGVLVRWHPPGPVARTMAHLLTPDDDLAAFTDWVFDGFRPGSEWLLHHRGDIGTDELAESMATRLGFAPADVRAMVDAVPDHVTLLPESLALLDDVAAAGARCVFLSNMPVGLARRLEADPVFARRFPDGGVFSCDVQLVKPEPETHAVAARRLGLVAEPCSTLLVDDREQNLVAARDVGWSGMRFSDATRARADLAAGAWM